MEKKEYNQIVKKYTIQSDKYKNAIIAFLIGGIMGIIGNLLVDFYSYIFDISTTIATSIMIITLVFMGCLLTCLGFFDKWVNFAKCGLIIPITGFAHAMMSAALDYKREGLVTGIGMNMFKLAGSVIIYGIVSAYLFGLIRIFIGG